VWLFINCDDGPGIRRSDERGSNVRHGDRTAAAPAPPPHPHPHRSLTPPQPRRTRGRRKPLRRPRVRLPRARFTPSGRSPERADRHV